MEPINHQYHQVIFMLQGGGALGAYQVGVCQGLMERGCTPNWVVGTSIGGINAAIIAGNKPEHRVSKLKKFWDTISLPFPDLFPGEDNEQLLTWQNIMNSEWGATFGVNGFFTPRVPPQFIFDDTPDKISFYDTGELRNTLNKLVDFDLINSKQVRLTLSATDLADGSLHNFDNTKQEITVDHIMASAALPPGFPAIKINDKYYWDGGICTNTPLAVVLDEHTADNLLCFTVNLFANREQLPNNMFNVLKRKKDIEFMSRYRSVLELFCELQRQQQELNKLRKQNGQEIDIRHPPVLNVVHFQYADTPSDLWSKDFEFSKKSIQDRMELGELHVKKAFETRGWLDLITEGVHLHRF